MVRREAAQPSTRPPLRSWVVSAHRVVVRSDVSDVDIPVNTLSFSLDDGDIRLVPAGVSIDPMSGEFSRTSLWEPTCI